jgi:hypothetical protein
MLSNLLGVWTRHEVNFDVLISVTAVMQNFIGKTKWGTFLSAPRADKRANKHAETNKCQSTVTKEE